MRRHEWVDHEDIDLARRQLCDEPFDDGNGNAVAVTILDSDAKLCTIGSAVQVDAVAAGLMVDAMEYGCGHKLHLQLVQTVFQVPVPDALRSGPDRLAEDLRSTTRQRQQHRRDERGFTYP